MGLELPDPPPLWGPQQPGDYEAVEELDDPSDDQRREELETFLQEGAWADAFDEWAAHTQLGEAEFEAAREANLIEALDFYWERSSGDVGYRSPGVESLPGDFDDYTAERVAEELDELAHTVSAHLERYVDRSGEEFGFFADGDEGW